MMDNKYRTDEPIAHEFARIAYQESLLPGELRKNAPLRDHITKTLGLSNLSDVDQRALVSKVIDRVLSRAVSVVQASAREEKGKITHARQVLAAGELLGQTSENAFMDNFTIWQKDGRSRFDRPLLDPYKSEIGELESASRTYRLVRARYWVDRTIRQVQRNEEQYMDVLADAVNDFLRNPGEDVRLLLGQSHEDLTLPTGIHSLAVLPTVDTWPPVLQTYARMDQQLRRLCRNVLAYLILQEDMDLRLANPNMDDLYIVSLFSLANFERHHASFISKQGGLWLLSSVEAADQAERAVEDIRRFTQRKETVFAWLAEIVSREKYREFHKTVTQDPIGIDVLRVWREWFTFCQCGEETDPTCALHGLVSSYERLRIIMYVERNRLIGIESSNPLPDMRAEVRRELEGPAAHCS